MSETDPHADAVIDGTVDIVVSYVAHNPVPATAMPALIAAVHRALAGLGTHIGGQPGAVPVGASIERPTPAQIRRSVTPDALVSFVDGKGYKTLKRHLGTHGFTPEGYRTRFGLPADYPMVCPSYSAQRSKLAKAIGLGVPGGRAEAGAPRRAA